MNDLATAKAEFLDRVEKMEPGEAVRFAPLLDALVAWSEAHGLAFAHHSGIADLVKFTAPGSKLVFWAATPRKEDGGKLSILADAKFPEALRAVARDELARIEGRRVPPDGPPEVAFIKLIWGPYRQRVFDLMERLLAMLKEPNAAPPGGHEAE